ncbi:MAG: short-chain dehydrogenase [Chlamydiae bacterium RIFCSPHIGHO2_12_FULL_49_9]|nr:MAG: short-chain dehydrogenase [Chlamydiae bacterium RIFCSPHIGHO2_12_FULL_49_9]
MDLGLKGKKVFVQGSSTGMGFAIAKGFRAEGAELSICSSDKERIEKAGREIGAKAALAIDLSKKGAGVQFVEEGVKKMGGIDVLILNTGGPKKGQFQELSLGDWEASFRGLWMSAIESIHAALPHMKKQRSGRILLLTSVAAKEPISGLTLSNSYRAGLLGLTKTLSREIGSYNIAINTVLPGYTKTERLVELSKDEKAFTSHIPMGRLGTPEEVAALFVFLASSQAVYITGQAIAVDGGYLHSI